MKLSSILLLFPLLLTACSFDGNYKMKKIYNEWLTQEKAYYDSESDEQKALRKKNQVFCTHRIREVYDEITKEYPHITSSYLYIDCMRTLGTPTYGPQHRLNLKPGFNLKPVVLDE